MPFSRPNLEDISQASSEELAQLAADCLARLEPGHQPLPLFKELSRLVVLSTFELVPIRPQPTGPEVLLTQRDGNDVWWPNQWHLPGVVLLPTDKEEYPGDYDTPLQRILEGEFSGSIKPVSDIHIFDTMRRSGPRGSEQTAFGWVEVEPDLSVPQPNDIRFFDALAVVENPPAEGLIATHDQTIRLAMNHYLAQ